MARPQKEQTVQEIQQKIEKSKGIFLFDYQGLNVESLTNLRIQLRKNDGEIKVFKNTLVKKALENLPIKDVLTNDFKGPIACAFSYSDPVAVAKALVDFRKEDESLNLKSGVLEKQKVSVSEIKELAKLPSRELLIAQVVGTLAAPLRGLVTVLSAVPRNFVYVLKAIEDKKGKS